MQHALAAMGPASAMEGGLRNHGTTLPTHLPSYSTTGLLTSLSTRLLTYASTYSYSFLSNRRLKTPRLPRHQKRQPYG